jgi:XTP/dITP diphosphohydrolase
MKLSVATTNPGKLREFALAGLAADPIPPGDAPEETGASFEENAILKALHYSARIAGPVLAEDSGLEVIALGGAPGIHSARWAAGDRATNDQADPDRANNDRLVREMAGVTERAARYVSVVAVAEDGALQAVFRGEVEGLIADPGRGSGGFGYDPHFFYPPFGATFAELTPDRKWEVSHRRRALDQLLDWLKYRRQAR